jgi:SNF2 family DNA or RNA helicase
LHFQLAARWKSMSDEDKQKYLDQEHQDRERFERESAEADVVRLSEREKRRSAQFVQEGEGATSRGARKAQDEERGRREDLKESRRAKREAEMGDDERAERDELIAQKKAEVDQRQRIRDGEEKAVAKQHKKLDKETSKKAANRLEYLFKQSPIFAKLKMGKGAMNDEPPEEEEKPEKKGRHAAAGSKPHHIHDRESADEEEEEEQEGEQHIFLTKQPSSIKFGNLKPYQLESLNWMIHLAEKGLNGILADEVSYIFSLGEKFASLYMVPHI